ncbi:MAG: DUF72 domain-containing protein [Thermodesulfobacteriota bacterium]|nr:DUF72 domain-containing protein [Thermodesulfobacteriota bacterium]
MYALNINYLKEYAQRYQVIPVLLQGCWIPSIVGVYRKWRKKILSHETVVVRLHGANRTDIEKRTGKRWDSIVAPMDNELVDIADLVRDLVDNGVNVYLNANNHYEGSAPLTIKRLSSQLDL